jgi:hypothetical protein
MAHAEIHTTPAAHGKGWLNEIDGDVVSRHETQDAAVIRGRRLAREGCLEHVIHNRDGTISEKKSYGDDPRPSKG